MWIRDDFISHYRGTGVAKGTLYMFAQGSLLLAALSPQRSCPGLGWNSSRVWKATVQGEFGAEGFEARIEACAQGADMHYMVATGLLGSKLTRTHVYWEF